MERGCHPSAFCDPLYVFPGNHQCLFMATVSYKLCLHWTGMTCVSFQIWNNDDMAHRRTQSCPFNNTGVRGVCSVSKGRAGGYWLYSDVSSLPILDFFQRNMWQNVSVSLGQGQMNNYRPMLRWNLSAPCRLEGEVWPCHKQGLGCWELQGFRQQLRKSTWRQNNKGHWVRKA